MIQLCSMKASRDPATRELLALKRILARTLRARLAQRKVTVASLARDTGTSRTAIRRVLDADNTSLTLHTLVRTAHRLGLRVRLSLEPSIDRLEVVPPPPSLTPLLATLATTLDRLPAR
jgi:DNA-binding phage protein